MDKEKTDAKKTKGHLNWEVPEKKLLIECVKLKLPILESKNVSRDADIAKQNAWLDVQDRFNSKNHRKRTLSDLQNQWQILKNGATKKIIYFNGFQRPPGAADPKSLTIKLEPVDLTEGDDEDVVVSDTDADDGKDIDSLVPNSDNLHRTKTSPASIHKSQRFQPFPSKKSIQSIDQKLFLLEAHRKQLKMNNELHQRKLQIINEERKLKLKYLKQDRQMQLDAIKESRKLELDAMKENQELKLELYRLQKEIMMLRNSTDFPKENSVDTSNLSLPLEKNQQLKLGFPPIEVSSGISDNNNEKMAFDNCKAVYVRHFEESLKLITDSHSFQIAKNKIDIILQVATSGAYKMAEEFDS